MRLAIKLLLLAAFSAGAQVSQFAEQQRSLVIAAITQKGVIVQWDADPKVPIQSQNFHIYSSTNGPYKTVPWIDPKYSYQVVDTNKLMQFTNWPQITVVTGFNSYFSPMTNRQRFFAVRAEVGGWFSGWGTHK